MPEIDWNVLTPAIKNKRCVLFLGPDAYPFDATQTVEQAMWAKTTTDAVLVRKYYADDGLVLFQKKSNRGRFMDNMKAFYGDKTADWSLTQLQLRKLIRIPFLAIVNLTFDDLLTQNFQEAGLDCEALHYIFRPSLTEKIIQDLPLETGKPLILNLLGSIRSSDNLVLTHADLFDFLKTLFTDKDGWLQELLHHADCFVFIGVPFEKWYMQLLLQKLSKYTKPDDEAERFALPENKEVKMHDLYTHELKIQFVESSQHTVIDELYRFCEDENILNKPHTEHRVYQNADFQAIYRLLLRGDIKQAIAAFLTWATAQSPVDKDNINDLTLLSAQYNTLEQDKNVLIFQEQKIERNRIIRALLHLLDTNDV
jgi:SIR2-like domain/Effector-associated domain 11